MGMFDSFSVREENTVAIPVVKDGYQSKSLDCSLARIAISNTGKLVVEDSGSDGYPHDDVQGIQAGTYCDTDLTIYGDGVDGKWHEYTLVVINSQIVRVHEWGDLLYLDKAYPLLDEVAHPVPENHTLCILKTVGTNEVKLAHVAMQVGKHRSSPIPDELFQSHLSSKHLGANIMLQYQRSIHDSRKKE